MMSFQKGGRVWAHFCPAPAGGDGVLAAMVDVEVWRSMVQLGCVCGMKRAVISCGSVFLGCLQCLLLAGLLPPACLLGLIPQHTV